MVLDLAIQIWITKKSVVIYPLSPKELDDKTLAKQIKAIAQVLVNASIWTMDLPNTEKVNDAFKNNPYVDQNSITSFTVDKIYNEYVHWARECRANYLKLVEMGFTCFSEYRCRGLINRDEYDSVYEYERILEWAHDNIPDLPEKLDCVGLPAIDTDPDFMMDFPVPPKEYIVMELVHYGEYPIHHERINFLESYRNYYRAQLHKTIKCGMCVGEGSYLVDEGESICLWCNGVGYTQKRFLFTRREMPEYLK